MDSAILADGVQTAGFNGGLVKLNFAKWRQNPLLPMSPLYSTTFLVRSSSQCVPSIRHTG